MTEEQYIRDLEEARDDFQRALRGAEQDLAKGNQALLEYQDQLMALRSSYYDTQGLLDDERQHLKECKELLADERQRLKECDERLTKETVAREQLELDLGAANAHIEDLCEQLEALRASLDECRDTRTQLREDLADNFRDLERADREYQELVAETGDVRQKLRQYLRGTCPLAQREDLFEELLVWADA